MKSLRAAVVLAGTALLSSFSASIPRAISQVTTQTANEDGTQAKFNGGSATVRGWGYRPGAPGGSSAAAHPAAAAAAEPLYAFRYAIACATNTIDNPANTLCGLAATGCQNGALMRWVYRAPYATKDDTTTYTRVGTQCMSDADVAAAATAAPFPGVTEADFRRLPLPPGTAHIQPDNGYVLINIPTNVYATATQVTLPTTVLGVAVQVRATPAAYTWTFGDGTTLGPTTDTGAPYPDLDLTHTYTQAINAKITLTTTYTGEYSVAGGPWLPIDGTATVTSAPIPIAVLSGHAALVADPLN